MLSGSAGGGAPSRGARGSSSMEGARRVRTARLRVRLRHESSRPPERQWPRKSVWRGKVHRGQTRLHLQRQLRCEQTERAVRLYDTFQLLPCFGLCDPLGCCDPFDCFVLLGPVGGIAPWARLCGDVSSARELHEQMQGPSPQPDEGTAPHSINSLHPISATRPCAYNRSPPPPGHCCNTTADSPGRGRGTVGGGAGTPPCQL